MLTNSKAYAIIEQVTSLTQKTNMLPLIKNPLTLSLVFATAFGVLAHDTQLDQVAAVAIAAPVTVSAYAIADISSKSSDHVHVEKVSVSSQTSASKMNVPKIQPRNDDLRFVQAKKQALGGGDEAGLWPSI